MPELIDTEDALARAWRLLDDQPRLAVDTETDSFFAYRPRICLLQVSVPGHDLLIDPLAGLDLAPLGAMLGDAGREVVLHAAENDVIHLQHEFGWRIANLFDTQVACFVLGIKPYSLAGILEARFGEKLDKSQQRSDWSRRPLAPEQVEYAAEDTCHLLELADDLHRRAREAGRIEEIAFECRRIADRAWEPTPPDPEAFRKIRGAKELDGRKLRLLRDLYRLREREAERRNRAPYRVASDAALVALAENWGNRPKKGVPEGFWRRYGSRIATMAERAREKGPLPPPPRRRRDAGEPMPPAVKRRYERLRRWRTRAAEERGVETFVVARNELLAKIAAAGCRTPDDLRPLLEPFRFREYGEAILAVLREGEP